MHYYHISLLGSPLEPFTYHYSKNIDIGTKVSVNVRNREIDGVVISTCSKPEFKTSEILEVSGFKYSSEQIKLANFISKYYFSSLGEALGLMTPFNNGFNQDDFSDVEVNSTVTLSDKQEDALAFLKQHETSLLFGDTGSGKTEIYMQYFYDMLKEKKRCIFLMPEISLTPQMGHRLQEHFGELVVMWHSKLTPKQKKIARQKIDDGTAYIIAGPRSALFLPINDLGLIVVDEEHDDSYKSSSRPRYNARDISIYMGKLYNIPVLYGCNDINIQ